MKIGTLVPLTERAEIKLRRIKEVELNEVQWKQYNYEVEVFLRLPFDKWLTFNQIVRKFGFSTRTISKILKRFEHDKLVQRKIDENSRYKLKPVSYRLNLDFYASLKFLLPNPQTLMIQNWQKYPESRLNLQFISVSSQIYREIEGDKNLLEKTRIAYHKDSEALSKIIGEEYDNLLKGKCSLLETLQGKENLARIRREVEEGK